MECRCARIKRSYVDRADCRNPTNTETCQQATGVHETQLVRSGSAHDGADDEDDVRDDQCCTASNEA